MTEDIKNYIFAIVKTIKDREIVSEINDFVVAMMTKKDWEKYHTLPNKNVNFDIIDQIEEKTGFCVSEIFENILDICNIKDKTKDWSGDVFSVVDAEFDAVNDEEVKDALIKIGLEYSDELEKFMITFQKDKYYDDFDGKYDEWDDEEYDDEWDEIVDNYDESNDDNDKD
jgi:hypothetical protein